MNNNSSNRPLSPHLTIHKKLINSILSITHRITGFGLSIGSIILVIWLLLIALGEEYYNITYIFYENVFGKLIIILWSFAIIFHLINGIRYLIWSVGLAINLSSIYFSSYIVIFSSTFITLLICLLAFGII